MMPGLWWITQRLQQQGQTTVGQQPSVSLQSPQEAVVILTPAEPSAPVSVAPAGPGQVTVAPEPAVVTVAPEEPT